MLIRNEIFNTEGVLIRVEEVDVGEDLAPSRTNREIYEDKLAELGGPPTTADRLAALEAVLDVTT